MKSVYKDFGSLYADVVNETVDLEELPRIGHKVAMEIRRWCIKHGDKVETPFVK